MTEPPVLGATVDLDDTLFPQQDWLAGAWAAVADRAVAHGLDGGALHRELLRIAAVGSDRGAIIDRALVAIGVASAEHVADLVVAFSEHRPVRLAGYPGSLAALARLQTVVPTVVVTDGNPDIQLGKVAALGLTGSIEVVVSDALGGRHLRKPHPAPFRAALELLGLDAGQVVHIGDRPNKDVAGARSAGMRAVRVRTGEYARLDDEPPWRSADTFAEAVEITLAHARKGTVGLASRL